MSEFGKELEGYFCKFTFGQFVTLILLELVTLFFVFYLGAHYGPDLIGSRRENLALPSEGPKNVDEIVGKQKVDYTFPEVLSDAPKQGAIRVKPSGVTAQDYDREKETGKQGPVTIPAPERVIHRPQAMLESKPPSSVAVEPTPAAVPQPVTDPEPAQPVAAESLHYSIQIGSYPSEQEATSAVARWKGKGYSSFMTVGEIPEKGTWYRVRIGSFKDKAEASGFLQKLKQKEKVKGLVVLSKS